MSETETKQKIDLKALLTSKAVWGSVIAGVATVLRLFGFDVDGLEAHIQTLILDGSTLFGAALAFYGRVVATKQIVKKQNA